MNEFITRRLKEYSPKSVTEEINALKEIVQEIILYALAQTDFFKSVFFCGGTSLRIVYKMDRFSEDLDFSTLNPVPEFNFDPYLESVLKTLESYGLEMRVSKKKDDSFVKSRELKEESFKWKLSFPSNASLKKVMIKLEIDSNPPLGARAENHFLDFPLLHRVSVGTADTLFSGKIHALLCRPYVKGRDWYDLLWYIKYNKSKINLSYLENALFQMGPYKEKKIKVDRDFVVKALSQKIESNNWAEVQKDVERFLKAEEIPSLRLWGSELFLDRAKKISS